MKFDDIFSHLDTIHRRDGQTDGQTDTGRQQRSRLRIASRGKIRSTFGKVMGKSRVSCFLGSTP